MALGVFFFSPEVRSVHLQYVQYYAVYHLTADATPVAN